MLEALFTNCCRDARSHNPFTEWCCRLLRNENKERADFKRAETPTRAVKNIRAYSRSGMERRLHKNPVGPIGKTAKDDINAPEHYTAHPSGIECILVTEHMNFCLGNAIKYIWRAGLKEDKIKDLKKAKYYLERELQRLGDS